VVRDGLEQLRDLGLGRRGERELNVVAPQENERG